MADDGIWERHGVHVRTKGDGKDILIGESAAGEIWIDGSYETRLMTPVQARYLARKLHRLARRIEQRTPPLA